MTYASLEARLNASVLKHLANVTVSLGGVDVGGVFSNVHAVTGGGMGMSTTTPALQVPTSSVPGSPVGQSITINGVSYAIAAHEPDGTGMSTLVLERSS